MTTKITVTTSPNGVITTPMSSMALNVNFSNFCALLYRTSLKNGSDIAAFVLHCLNENRPLPGTLKDKTPGGFVTSPVYSEHSKDVLILVFSDYSGDSTYRAEDKWDAGIPVSGRLGYWNSPLKRISM